MDTRSFREIVRTVTVSYPIPFLFALLIAPSAVLANGVVQGGVLSYLLRNQGIGTGRQSLLFCFTGAAVLQGPKSWVFAATGIVSFLVAVGIAIYAVMRKPDLLRSERYSLVNRYIDLLEDGDMDQTTRDAAAKTIDGYMEESVPKRTLSGSKRDPRSSGRE